MKYFLALLAALTLNATANLMLKIGSGRLDRSAFSLENGIRPLIGTVLTNWVLVVGLCLFAANVVFYTYALTGLKISMAYPVMFGGGFAIIATVSFHYLGERLTPGQWIGVGAILLGICLVARGMSNPVETQPSQVAAVEATSAK